MMKNRDEPYLEEHVESTNLPTARRIIVAVSGLAGAAFGYALFWFLYNWFAASVEPDVLAGVRASEPFGWLMGVSAVAMTLGALSAFTAVASCLLNGEAQRDREAVRRSVSRVFRNAGESREYLKQ